VTTNNSRIELDYENGRMRLVRLPDGYELDPPWDYSDSPQVSLGLGRYQLVVDDSVSDEEIGHRIRAYFGGLRGRMCLLDVHAFMPSR